MIIYGENTIEMALSEIGIDVENAFKYDRTEGSDQYAIDLPFVNNDMITELLKDDIELLAMENGYYGNEHTDKAIKYKSRIEFVYFFERVKCKSKSNSGRKMLH